MATVKMQTFNLQQGPVITSYSGYVTPLSDGTVTVDARDVGTMQILGFTVINAVAESPTYANVTISSLTSNSILFAGAGGLIQGTAGGTSYSSSSAALLAISPTFTSSNTGSFELIFSQPTLVSTAGTPPAINGMVLVPKIGAANSNLNSFTALTLGVATQIGYTGTVSYSAGLYINSPNLASGTKPIQVLAQIDLGPISNGDGITSGTVTNYGLYGEFATAAAGIGGIVKNYSVFAGVGSASSAGTTNTGLLITGNGGAASTNWALYSDSTAASAMLGKLSIGKNTAPANMVDVLGPSDNTITAIRVGKADPGSGANRLTSQLQFINGGNGNVMAAVGSDPSGTTNFDLGFYTNGTTLGMKLTAAQLLTLYNTTLLATAVSLTNGASVAAGTLTNAPTAGNPTKWVPINDNGTTRYIPAW